MLVTEYRKTTSHPHHSFFSLATRKSDRLLSFRTALIFGFVKIHNVQIWFGLIQFLKCHWLSRVGADSAFCRLILALPRCVKCATWMLLATDMELIGIYDVGSQVPAPVLPCIALRFGYPIEIVGSQSNWVHTTLCSIVRANSKYNFQLGTSYWWWGIPVMSQEWMGLWYFRKVTTGNVCNSADLGAGMDCLQFRVVIYIDGLLMQWLTRRISWHNS